MGTDYWESGALNTSLECEDSEVRSSDAAVAAIARTLDSVLFYWMSVKAN